ncbi:SurA N-terminal domain-containing protein [Actinomadura rubteroloni]|uniref:SurA N-terminal domain-containing protein n=1 Tax=Actinomadura rubteroloni TaxID=1926885 RepID=UPI000CD8E8F3|nr:SurA N-terminal domain-containing protein [Actinomadura rubteroloni]
MRFVKSAGAVVLAAGTLAGCGGSPVQAGSAAIVGDQRITIASLDRDVRDWQRQFRDNAVANALKEQSGGSADDAVRQALGTLVRIRVADQTARRAGVAVTEGRTDAVVAGFDRQSGGAAAITLANGLPVRYIRDVARFFAIRDALAARLLPPRVTSAQQVMDARQRAEGAISAVAAGMTIKINPRYGSFDRAHGMIGPVTTRLSGTERGLG